MSAQLSSRSSTGLLIAIIPVVLFLLPGCRKGLGALGSGGGKSSSAQEQRVVFTDVSEDAGLHFVHRHGGCGTYYMPETVPGGCAFLDFDNDNWSDVMLLNGAPFPRCKTSYASSKPPMLSLFRNKQDGTFEEVTLKAGLGVSMYGMGCAAADYDSDGFVDIYITCIGANYLFRNNGDGTFSDVTTTARVAGAKVPPYGLVWKWSASAAWADYDRDGNLDLFVCNYARWSPKEDIWCGFEGRKSYCTPEAYDGVPSTLYRNQGDGTFADVSSYSGIKTSIGKSFGVAVMDADRDGYPDFAVTNDTQPNFLFHNLRDGRFEEVALRAGFALNDLGVARAGMGIDAADASNDGKWSIITSNFHGEMVGFYQESQNLVFQDSAISRGVGKATAPYLGFGIFFFDYDLDGWKDIFVGNGHVVDIIDRQLPGVSYRQPSQLLHNARGKRFQDVTSLSGKPFGVAMVIRGATFGDYDLDGDQDILMVWNNKKAMLWRNDGGSFNNWLKVRLVGTRTNRDGIGAYVRVESGALKQNYQIKSGSSFLSEAERELTVGIGRASQVSRLTVNWPSGAKTILRDVPANKRLTIVEASRS